MGSTCDASCLTSQLPSFVALNGRPYVNAWGGKHGIRVEVRNIPEPDQRLSEFGQDHLAGVPDRPQDHVLSEPAHLDEAHQSIDTGLGIAFEL